ncbi:MAG TPA: hypothetical protein PKI32_07960 [Opitutales bacterium]|nr:hypothetical protein [Opitutales bacterium]
MRNMNLVPIIHAFLLRTAFAASLLCLLFAGCAESPAPRPPMAAFARDDSGKPLMNADSGRKAGTVAPVRPSDTPVEPPSERPAQAH